MAVTALDLINRSWYLSGIVGRGLETVSGEQGTDGLMLLNALLDFKATDTKLIPYYVYSQFNLVQGQELYYIPGLVQLETFTFYIGTVRYPTTEVQRVDYFGNGRVEGIQSLPFTWNLERVKGGANLRIYYAPMGNYVASISGKYALTDVTLFTDLSLTYDGFYIEYLRYALAEYMCQYYDVQFGADKERMMQKMEKKLAWVSPPDLSMQKANFISGQIGLTWAQVNIGKGWTALV